MHKVLVLGAGKIGSLISGLLAESGEYGVHVADVDGEVARTVVAAHRLDHLHAHGCDARDPAALAALLRAHPVGAVISSLPYYCNVAVAEAARPAGIHYFDLTEDVAVTRAVRRLADGAAQAFVPQCGLAPGFVSIAANALIAHFDELRSVKLRVGALPQHPNNVLKYSLTCKKGAALAIRVTPRASRNEIVEIFADGTVRIRLTAPPAEGKANVALVEFLADVLDIAPSRIEIVAGTSGRDKLVSILDMDTGEVQRKILDHLE